MEHVVISLGFTQPPSEEDIARTRMAREGLSIPLSPDIFAILRKRFEMDTRFNPIEKAIDRLGNTALVLSPIALVSLFAQSSAPTSFIAIGGLAVSAWATAVAAVKGRRHQSISDARIEKAKMIYNAMADSHVKFLEHDASAAAKSNFVATADQSVRAGKALSMEDLAKLVNFDAVHLKEACDKLAITVLQAKMMLALQEKKVEPFTIANSSDAGWEKGTHEDFLALKLWDQMRHLRAISSYDDDTASIHDSQPHSGHKKEKSAASQSGTSDMSLAGLAKAFGQAMSHYFMEGLKANKLVYQDPKADMHLPAIPSQITIPTFPAVPDLADRIQRYGMEHLDLPALAQR